MLQSGGVNSHPHDDAPDPHMVVSALEEVFRIHAYSTIVTTAGSAAENNVVGDDSTHEDGEHQIVAARELEVAALHVRPLHVSVLYST